MSEDLSKISIHRLGSRLQRDFLVFIIGSLCMESKSRSFTISQRALKEFMSEAEKSIPRFSVDGDQSTDLSVELRWEK
jgi:hypothetical protein